MTARLAIEHGAIDFRAVNAVGLTLMTFNDIARARKWVRENAAKHSGLCVVEAITSTRLRKVYTAPVVVKVADDLAIPPPPDVPGPSPRSRAEAEALDTFAFVGWLFGDRRARA